MLAALKLHPEMPDELKDLAKRAADHADAALLLDEAAQQNRQADPTSPSPDPTQG
jgi:hypothetical protein